MEGILLAMQGALSQGVLWAIMTIGVYITFKVLDYADLTVDGSFATGGAVSAVLVLQGVNPWLSLLAATVVGMLCGLVTGLLHTKVKIPAILAGILTQIALYSINIRIMDGSNVPLLRVDTILTPFLNLGLDKNWSALVVGGIFVVAIIGLLYWFFGTELGSCIRATGNNEYMVRALGGNTDHMKVLGLVLSNGLVALSGAMIAQQQGYADAQMGTGVIVIGLAAVIIGEVIMGNRFSFAYKLTSVVVGSVIYRVIIAAVLQMDFVKSTDLKLLTAILVTLALALPVLKSKFGRQEDKPARAQRKEN